MPGSNVVAFCRRANGRAPAIDPQGPECVIVAVVRESQLEPLAADGFLLLRGVFPAAEMSEIGCQLDEALEADVGGATLRARGGVYGARHLLDVCSAARTCWRREPLTSLLDRVLGCQAGLVRGLYFDKPPERTWSLPWHRDLTIAVSEHGPLPEGFAKPTTKAGVPHVEAPRALLQSMLTLRIHLDPMTEENGPLLVIPGSHDTNSANRAGRAAETIRAACGDVLAMRPLLAHSSIASRPGTSLRRRVVHLEFASHPRLPGHLGWRDFVPVHPD